MSYVDQIITELCVIDSDLSEISSNIVREQNEFARVMEKVQSYFGDQTAGQELVGSLYSSMQMLISADSSIYSLKQKIQYAEQTVED